MKTFKVLLHRDYIVNIDAGNKNDAAHLAEFYIAGERDVSNEKEKEEYNFRINNIEMVLNDVFEIIEE